MKRTLALLVFLLAAAIGSLLLPTRVRLELYDVQDMTYSLADFGGGVSISLTPCVDLEWDYCFTGEELANGLRFLTPGLEDEASGRTIQFQNGLIIVRGTAPQHAAIRTCLTVCRAGLCVYNDFNERFARAKITICAAVLGIITR